MRKHRTFLIVSALTLATMTLGPVAQARELQPADDRGANRALEVHNRADELRNGANDLQVDDRGVDPVVELRHGADDPQFDDSGRSHHDYY